MNENSCRELLNRKRSSNKRGQGPQQGRKGKVFLQAAIGLKTPHGGISFGRAHWLNGDFIKVESSGYLERGMDCELKIELKGKDGWIFADATVVKMAPASADHMVQALLCIKEMSGDSRRRLDGWVDGRRSQERRQRDFLRLQRVKHPSVRTDTTPGAGRGVGFRTAPSLPPQTEHPRRKKAKQAKTSVMDKPIPLRDPQYGINKDGSEVSVQWFTARQLRQDWSLHLSRRRMSMKCPQPTQKRVLVHLWLPTGEKITTHARVGTRRPHSWIAMLELNFSQRQKIRRAGGVSEMNSKKLARGGE